MTTKEIIDTLNKKFGIVKDEAWFTSLSKTAHSKNITVAEWNAIIYQVAAAVGSADALREALTDIIEYDELTLKNVLDRLAANATQISTNTSNIAIASESISQVADDVNTGFDETRRTFDELRTDFDKDFETVSQAMAGYERFTEARFEQVEGAVDTKVSSLAKEVSDAVSRLDESTDSIKGLPRTIEFSISDDFKLTAILKDENNSVVDTATVDLPLEESVVGMTFDDTTDEIVFTLRNGITTKVPITGVLRGIVTNLESTEDNKVLAASVGPIIVHKINEAVADKITATQLNDILTEALKNYATTEDVQYNITQTQLSTTLNGYVKTDAIENFVTVTDVDGMIENALDNYTPKCEVTGTEFAGLAKRVETVESDKVDKITAPNVVYATDATGTSQSIAYGDGANAIAQRTATGGLSVPGNAIVNPTDAVNKDYVDNQVLIGKDGKSAYQLALDEGFEGSLSEWLASLVGKQGAPGNDGKDGKPFVIAKIYTSVDEMNADYSNTEVERGSFVTIDTGNIDDEDNAKLFVKGATGFVYLTDLSGATGLQGPPGKSAYELAKANGFVGTVTEWLASLKGANGKDGGEGKPGADGKTPYIQDGYWYIDGINLNVKAQGEPGTNGERGTGILRVTSAPTSYTTAIGGKNPIKRMLISTIKTQSGVGEVLVGDLIAHSYYQYHIYHLDASYAYMDTYQSIRGSAGAAGKTAYDYAQDGGYTGTEAEFAAKLAQDKILLYSAQSLSDEEKAQARMNIGAEAPLEYANSIEECVDTSKRYVLPDGYIYAYQLTTYEKFTDVLKNVGFTPDMRINSSGAIAPANGNGSDVTGYIPCKPGDIIRIEDMDMPNDYLSGHYWSLVGSYDSNKTYIASNWLYASAGNTGGALVDVVYDSAGQVKQFTVKESVFGSNVAYIVINAKNITTDSKVYVNSEIVTEYTWVNTGVYQGAGDKLIELEEAVNDHENRLSEIEDGIANGELGGASENIPTYVIEEAEATIAKLFEHGNLGRTIRFIAISDTHEDSANTQPQGYGPQIEVSNRHAGQAIKYISDRIGLDFVAHLGDASGCGSFSSTYGFDALCEDIGRTSRNVFGNSRDVKHVFIPGNHDMMSTPGRSLLNSGAFTFFGSQCSGTKNRPGGYGYFDIEDANVRVIYLNTSDSPSSAAYLTLTQAQKNWLCETLINVNTKANASEWDILLLSHAPLDFNGVNISTDILLAYVNGGTYNSYSFNGKNSAKIIGNVHGHVHCFSYGYLADKIRRFTIPNACYVGSNHYKNHSNNGAWADDTTYDKTANSGKDTSFSLVTIDLDSGECYVDNYGAGIDRVFSTDYKPIGAVVPKLISNISYSGDTTVGTAIDKSKFTFTVTYSDDTTRTVTGATTVEPETIGEGSNSVNIEYTENGITISGTTVIVSTASAPSNEIWTSVESDKTTPYNGGAGYVTGKRLNSSGVEKDLASAVTTGFIPYKGGAIEVVLPNTSTSSGNNYIHLYSTYQGALVVLLLDANGNSITGDRHQAGVWVSSYGASRTIHSKTQDIKIPAASIPTATEYIRVSADIGSGVTISDDTFSVKNTPAW